jgi:RNA polymerase sigma-70 factor (ECF subfamily)
MPEPIETPRDRPSIEKTSLSLLERAVVKDESAWRKLVELYSPLVFSWCRKSGLRNEECTDLMQEVFAAVAVNIGKFRRERVGDTFRGWMRTIARNQVRLYFRRGGAMMNAAGGTSANRQIQEIPDGLFEESDPETEKREAGDVFRRALEMVRGEFEPHTWRAFWLATVDELPSADVCRELKMTSGAVRQAKYKVLRRLRTELGELLE